MLGILVVMRAGLVQTSANGPAIHFAAILGIRL